MLQGEARDARCVENQLRDLPAPAILDERARETQLRGHRSAVELELHAMRGGFALGAQREAARLEPRALQAACIEPQHAARLERPHHVEAELDLVGAERVVAQATRARPAFDRQHRPLAGGGDVGAQRARGPRQPVVEAGHVGLQPRLQLRAAAAVDPQPAGAGAQLGGTGEQRARGEPQVGAAVDGAPAQAPAQRTQVQRRGGVRRVARGASAGEHEAQLAWPVCREQAGVEVVRLRVDLPAQRVAEIDAAAGPEPSGALAHFELLKVDAQCRAGCGESHVGEPLRRPEGEACARAVTLETAFEPGLAAAVQHLADQRLRQHHVAPVEREAPAQGLAREAELAVGAQHAARMAQRRVDREVLAAPLEAQRLQFDLLVVDLQRAGGLAAQQAAAPGEARPEALQGGVGQQVFARVEWRHVQRETPRQVFALLQAEVQARHQRLAQAQRQVGERVAGARFDATGDAAFAGLPAKPAGGLTGIEAVLSVDRAGEMQFTLRSQQVELAEVEAGVGPGRRRSAAADFQQRLAVALHGGVAQHQCIELQVERRVERERLVARRIGRLREADAYALQFEAREMQAPLQQRTWLQAELQPSDFEIETGAGGEVPQVDERQRAAQRAAHVAGLHRTIGQHGRDAQREARASVRSVASATTPATSSSASTSSMASTLPVARGSRPRREDKGVLGSFTDRARSRCGTAGRCLRGPS